MTLGDLIKDIETALDQQTTLGTVSLRRSTVMEALTALRAAARREEVQAWDNGQYTKDLWHDTPQAIPNRVGDPRAPIPEFMVDAEEIDGPHYVIKPEARPQVCGKTVSHPAGMGGTAYCREASGHEGNCPWPWEYRS